MKKHSSRILRLAALMASRESGFIFAFLGVMVQMSHTWFIAYDLSSLPGIWRFIQAGAMSFFISAALLYFVLKSSDDTDPRSKKWRKTVNMFAWLETCINLYYWGHKLLWQAWPDPDYGSFIIALPFSFVIPFTLKAYSSEVRVEDFSDLEETPESESQSQLTEDDVKRISKEYLDSQCKICLASKQEFIEHPKEHPVEETSTEQPKEEPMEQVDESNKDNFKEFVEQVKEETSTEKPVEEVVEETYIEQPGEQTKEESVEQHPAEEVVEETYIEQPGEQTKEDISTEHPKEEMAVDLPELGKDALSAILNGGKQPKIENGGYTSAPAYVHPKQSVDDTLFNYEK